MPPPPPNKAIYDLIMDSDDEIDRRSVPPAENPLAQLIDLTEEDDTPTIAGLAQPAQETRPQDMPPAITTVQPLTLYWKMRINRKINTYHTDRPVRRDEDEEIITSVGINGAITLTVKDFCGLTMIRNPEGFVNDNIIDAFLQTLDVFSRYYSRGVNGSARTPPHSVFLSSQMLVNLQKAATLPEKEAAYYKQILHKVFNKHGVTSVNLASVENVFLPVHLPATDPKNRHWVLAIWHPRYRSMTWWDSAAPNEGGPREQFADVGRYIKHFWADFCRREVPQSNGARNVVDVDQSAWTARDMRCPQQKNASDCGVFVMAACLCKVLCFRGYITGQGKENLMRNYFAAVLLQCGWGRELPWGMPSPAPMPTRHYEKEISPEEAGYLRA